MFRLLLFAICLVAISGCHEVRTGFSEARVRAHYDANKAAFDRLASELNQDTETEAASYYPPHLEEYYLSPDHLSPEQIANWESWREHYADLLADLSFPGAVTFYRRPDGAFWFPEFGGHRANDARHDLSLVYFPEATEPILGCLEPSINEVWSGAEYQHQHCYRQMDDRWYFLWQRNQRLTPE